MRREKERRRRGEGTNILKRRIANVEEKKDKIANEEEEKEHI